MKNRFLIALILFIAFMLMVSSSAWDDMGPFDYWYSDKSVICHFPSSETITIAIFGSSNGMPVSKLQTYTIHATEAWESEGPFVSATSEDCSIGVHSVTRAQAEDSDVPATVDAYTITDASFEGYASYNGSKMTVKTINSSDVVLIYDSSSMSYSDAEWQAVTAHEFGHAIGYDGHDQLASANSPALMHPSSSVFWHQWGIDTPTTRDLRHAGNI